MRVALGQFNEMTHERLTFAQQIGVSGVQMNTPLLPAENGYWEYEDLARVVERTESYGLKLEALENVPVWFYEKAMLGLPGRDEQIENYQRTIRNMGKAGIPLLGYHWMPNGVWRTPMARGRGGVTVTAYDGALIDQPLVAGRQVVPGFEGRTMSADELWENYRYFTSAVLPVAEEAGVRLALHPDDPPVPELGGIARLFYHFEGFRKAMEDVAPSPNHGLDFCMGCFSEMYYSDSETNQGVLDAMRYFGERGKLFYVHFRDVKGTVPNFEECFLGEGNMNVVEAMKTLHEVGFDGFIIDDHVAHMIDDSDWNHRGHAHATGYILGLVDAVKQLA